MSIYYFSLDATGNADGSSEANAYDGTSTVTLPDGSSGVCRINNIVYVMPPGDILYVKKSDDTITWHASTTNPTQANDGPTNFAQGYGPVRIIGYGSTVTDGIRPTINMGGNVWRFNRRSGEISNFNFSGTYSAGSIKMSADSLISNCRLHNLNTTTASQTIYLEGGGADRCELISDQTSSDPTGSPASVVYIWPTGNSRITNCYIEARNGVHGIMVGSRSASMNIFNNIINVNLDVGGAGNDNGSGIYCDDIGYQISGNIIGNIIHNGKYGIYLGGTSSRVNGSISGNLFSSCATAIDGTSHYNAKVDANDTAMTKPISSYNNFYWSNTANSYLNSERNPVYLISDPFVDYVNKDFSTKDASLSEFGYAKSFTQPGASGDTTTSNALVPLRRFTVTTSGSLSLGTGDVGDVVTVSGTEFQKISNSPIVWNVI